MRNEKASTVYLKIAGITILLLVAGALTTAQAGDRWLHIRVHGSGPDERVSVNLPVKMLAAMAPSVEAGNFSGGKLRLGDDEDGVDVRKVLEALRDAPDGDFITVKSQDENIRVARRGSLFEARIDDGPDERVRISMPLSVIDALLGDGEGELDIAAALERLADYPGGDLITVESPDEKVRIWIDDDENGD